MTSGNGAMVADDETGRESQRPQDPQGPEDARGRQEPPPGPGTPPPYGGPYDQAPPPPYGPGAPPYGPGAPPPYGGWGWMPPLPPKPGVIPLGPPLGLGEIIGGAFGTLGRSIAPLLAIGSALYGALVLVVLVVGVAGYLAFQDTVDAMAEQDTLDPFGASDAGVVIALGIVAALVLLAASFFIYGVLSALSFVVLEPAVVGQRLTVTEAWRRSRSRAWAVVGTSFLTGLIAVVPFVAGVALAIGLGVAVGEGSVGLGVLLGILLGLGALVYAVWMWTRLSLAPAAVVLEGAGPVQALRRSAQLVRGSWWRILGISLLGWFIAQAASQVIQFVLSFMVVPLMALPIGFAESDGAGAVVGAFALLAIVMLVSLAVSVFISAFIQMITGLLYVDRRIRTEHLAPVLLEASGLTAGAPGPNPYPYPNDGGYPGRHV
ncbi:hypothetical protein AB0M28_22515 [Streptomyces sp. NPDC051940]|uniref:DUF7544 domain-containing protein n=1 Tax=Streptomyces sp. NPDC051940 TaxID=3155675 RepID=UPI003437077E